MVTVDSPVASDITSGGVQGLQVKSEINAAESKDTVIQDNPPGLKTSGKWKVNAVLQELD